MEFQSKSLAGRGFLIGMEYTVSWQGFLAAAQVIRGGMPIQTTYSYARKNLAALCDEVIAKHDIAIIHRRGAKDLALIEADELNGLLETIHLLRSPRNAQRLTAALTRALKSK